MKRYLLLFLSVISALLVIDGTYSYAGIFPFTSNSVLHSGRWIKVETGGTGGIYEISYEQLAELGFDNPSAVSVYGEGGAMRPQNFITMSGPAQSDNPEQVPLFHYNNKIYFYGLGLQNPELGEEGYTYDARNIYNNAGHYFITDTGSPLMMDVLSVDDAVKGEAIERKDGLDYIICDEDKVHGRSDTGQCFWNYSIYDMPGNKYSFQREIRYAASSGNASLETAYAMILTPNDISQGAGLAIRVNNQNVQVNPNTQLARIFSHTMRDLSLESETVDIEISANSLSFSYCNLDYWILNYPKDLTVSGEELLQERLGFCASSQLENSCGYTFVPEGCLTMDITDMRRPVMLEVSDNKAWFPDAGNNRTLMIFNPDNIQMQVYNPQPVNNTNLHEYRMAGIDFLIITVPEYREYAEELAELHRKMDGMKVVVTDPQDIYNEFSAGNTDPTAIRMFVKMLYEGTGQLRNVLLFGPLRSDIRNIGNLPQPAHFLPIYQEPGDLLSEDREHAPVLDYYGITRDMISLNRMWENTVDVGVGILPVSSPRMARIAVDKVNNYLRSLHEPEIAEIANEFLSFSCTGDAHTHDNQAKQLTDITNGIANDIGVGRFVCSSLVEDAFGDRFAPEIMKRLNEGKIYSTYFGHASQSGLGEFFTMANFLGLTNRLPSFIFFAGCDLSRPDYGISGIGIEPVLLNTGGLVGSICSTRRSWSTNNNDLAGNMVRSLFYTPKNIDKLRSEPVTMGEAFASMKTTATVAGFNKLNFVYVGDPALLIPVPLKPLRLDIVNPHSEGYRGGDVIVIDGVVLTGGNKVDTSVTGTIVVKLAAPEKLVRVGGTEYGALDIPYSDNVLSTVRGEVSAGRFSIRIPVPQKGDDFLRNKSGDKNSFIIYACAYSPERRMTYHGSLNVLTAVRDSEPETHPDDNPDTEAPSINLNYNGQSRLVTVDVSDNLGIIPGLGAASGTSLYIDSEPVIFDISGPDKFCGVRDYRVDVPVGNFLNGKHTARLVSMDMSGNRSEEQTIDFILTSDLPELGFEALQDYCIDSMEFKVNSTETVGLEFYILDSEGMEIYNDTVDSSVIRWIRPDNVTPGNYKAGLRSVTGNLYNTKLIEFTIID